jgi:hypothetical protein
MPEPRGDLPSSCNPLFLRRENAISQGLAPDPLPPPARDARGRFAKGASGNPRGRPGGIPNPKPRLPNLVARPLSAQALSDLLDRKPHLLAPLAAQLLPPPLAAPDPAELLGIDLSSADRAEQFRQAMAAILAGIAGGKISPGEGARLTRRLKCATARYRTARTIDGEDTSLSF